MKGRGIVYGLGLVGFGAALLLHQSGGSADSQTKPQANKAMIERGKMLVTIGGCTDCHTPWTMGPHGPEPDTTRFLSGSPSDGKLPEYPSSILGPDKWGFAGSNDFTVWAGPWGVSFTRNLTPDVNTGLGTWTEEMFIKTLRLGKHMGEGRDLLPPMPWQNLAQMKDEDLKAIYAYLRTIRPIENAVPEPIPPPGH